MPIITSLLIIVGIVTGGGLLVGATVGATACVVERERTAYRAAELKRNYETRFYPKSD